MIFLDFLFKVMLIANFWFASGFQAMISHVKQLLLLILA